MQPALIAMAQPSGAVYMKCNDLLVSLSGDLSGLLVGHSGQVTSAYLGEWLCWLLFDGLSHRSCNLMTRNFEKPRFHIC